MTEAVEFGTLEQAKAIRERHGDHLAELDDRRQKTVRFQDDTPSNVLELAEEDALISQQDVAAKTYGQRALTDREVEQLEKRSGWSPQKRFHAMSAKAVLQSEGVRSWLDHYDPDLNPREHLQVIERGKDLAVIEGLTGPGETGRVDDSDPDLGAQGKSADRARGQACNHAEDHCRHGDPAACEFLRDGCGFSDDQVAAILEDESGAVDEGEFPGPVYGALEKAWTGFRAGLGSAKQWAAAINEIRRQHGQEPMVFEELGDRPITVDDLET